MIFIDLISEKSSLNYAANSYSALGADVNLMTFALACFTTVSTSCAEPTSLVITTLAFKLYNHRLKS